MGQGRNYRIYNRYDSPARLVMFHILIHLLLVSFLFMVYLKANSKFFFKSIHDGIDLKFLKR